MSKFTPGPWGIINGDAGPIIFSGDKGSMVAQAIKAITTEKRDANARLIAAAPELYEFAFEITRRNWDDGEPIISASMYDKLVTLLAKVDGEAK